MPYQQINRVLEVLGFRERIPDACSDADFRLVIEPVLLELARRAPEGGWGPLRPSSRYTHDNELAPALAPDDRSETADEYNRAKTDAARGWPPQ